MAVWLKIVIPCYQEEEVLPETSKRLKDKMLFLMEKGIITENSRVLLVDDGSKDNTWHIIEKLHQENPLFEGVRLSRNQGHQNALLAGLMTARQNCEACISMDADLQDDINAIDAFLQKFNDGCDVVYGVRSSRKKDSVFKRESAIVFYKLMNALGAETIPNHADYRLLSNRALNALSNFQEVNLFLRGIVPLVGFQSDCVKYERAERFAGKSKYPLKKMMRFAIDGITSFSVKPLRMITCMGGIVFLISLIMLFYALISKILGKASAGWTSIIGSIWLIGGIQLLSLGTIGEYIGKIYNESKHRPRFIIEKYLNNEGRDPAVDGR